MTIFEIRALTQLSQPQFCEKYNIPLPTLRKWEQGKRKPPDYVKILLEFKVKEDLGMNNDLISKSALLEEMEKFCGNQRYLVPENIWNMVENFPTFSGEKQTKIVDTTMIDEMNDLKDVFKGTSVKNTEEMLKNLSPDEKECLLKLYVYENKQGV